MSHRHTHTHRDTPRHTDTDTHSHTLRSTTPSAPCLCTVRDPCCPSTRTPRVHNPFQPHSSATVPSIIIHNSAHRLPSIDSSVAPPLLPSAPPPVTASVCITTSGHISKFHPFSRTHSHFLSCVPRAFTSTLTILTNSTGYYCCFTHKHGTATQKTHLFQADCHPFVVLSVVSHLRMS